MELLKTAGLPNCGRPSASVSQSAQLLLSALVNFGGAVLIEPEGVKQTV